MGADASLSRSRKYIPVTINPYASEIPTNAKPVINATSEIKYLPQRLHTGIFDSEPQTRHSITFTHYLLEVVYC